MEIFLAIAYLSDTMIRASIVSFYFSSVTFHKQAKDSVGISELENSCGKQKVSNTQTQTLSV